jgi:hypothetical protein
VFLSEDSGGEQRFIAIGMSELVRVLFVVHVERGQRDGLSARGSLRISRRPSMQKAAKKMQPTKESLDEIPELDLNKAKVIGRGLRKDRRLPLRVLREAIGKTQAEVARASEMDQSEISRVEQREDLKLSTLRRYARALGASVEVTAVLKSGRRIRLDL